MAQQWEVVGGAEKGIVVREGKDLKSKELDRLACGSIVEQIGLVGERLNYKVIDPETKGAAEGWVSLKLKDKDLVVKKMTELADNGGPADSSFAVEVDEELKKHIEAKAAEMKEKDMLNLSAFKYKLCGGPLAEPKFRIICFHNAGSTESQFATPSSDLWKWIKKSKSIEMIALDYPGRDKIVKEKPISVTSEMAEWLLAIIHEKLADGVPYMIWGHSVGALLAFEVLMLARKIGLPMPKSAVLNAFPAPHMPVAQRPWRRSKYLNDADMREELMWWDEGHFTGAGKIVFDDPGWKDTWEPMMRADFQLFDEYEFKHKDASRFDFPLHCWHMGGEKLNQQYMIEMWKDWAAADFDHCTIEGWGHLTCFYNPDNKKEYYAKVMDLIKKYSGIE